MVNIATILYCWYLIFAEDKMKNPITLMNEEVNRQDKCGHQCLHRNCIYATLLGGFLKELEYYIQNLFWMASTLHFLN